MIARIVLVALIATASPSMAADLASTHEVVEVGPGKLHARAYRPLGKSACAALAKGHPVGGKGAAVAPDGLQDASCAKQEAEAEAKANKG